MVKQTAVSCCKERTSRVAPFYAAVPGEITEAIVDI